MAVPWFGAAAACLILVSCGTGYCGNPPRYDHIVIVIEENKSATQVVAGPYLALLKAGGAFMARSYGEVHPSQPNYFALFSGSLNGVTDNNPHDITAPNLAARACPPRDRSSGNQAGTCAGTTPAQASPGCRRAP